MHTRVLVDAALQMHCQTETDNLSSYMATGIRYDRSRMRSPLIENWLSVLYTHVEIQIGMHWISLKQIQLGAPFFSFGEHSVLPEWFAAAPKFEYSTVQSLSFPFVIN
jgi:hypothetical protein